MVHDVPLIAENNMAGAYDLVVVVDVPPRLQLDRLVRHRGLTREQARARMAAQASREQRLGIAGIVVDNSGSLAELDRQVGELWDRAAPPGRAGHAGWLTSPAGCAARLAGGPADWPPRPTGHAGCTDRPGWLARLTARPATRRTG